MQVSRTQSKVRTTISLMLVLGATLALALAWGEDHDWPHGVMMSINDVVEGRTARWPRSRASGLVTPPG
jgi:hypothetical protein